MRKVIQPLIDKLLKEYPDLAAENSRFRATLRFVRCKGRKVKAVVKFALGTFTSEGDSREEAGRIALGLANARLTLDCGG